MLGICDGTRVIGPGSGSLKRDLLFFDKLILLGGSEAAATLRSLSKLAEHRELADELEYLLDTPFFESAIDNDAMRRIKNPSTEEEESINLDIEWLMLREQEVTTLRQEMSNNTPDRKKLEKIMGLRQEQVNMLTRLAAIRRSRRGLLAVSNEPMPSERVSPRRSSVVSDVIQVSINMVPVPDDLTPWEDIFAIKEDKDVSERARKLRLWAIDQDGSQTPLAHLAEKMADMVSDYERVLGAHRIKCRSSLLRSVVVGAAGMLEDLVKFRFEKAADRIFSAKISKADMLLAEAAAPGRELSLVTVLRDKLTTRS